MHKIAERVVAVVGCLRAPRGRGSFDGVEPELDIVKLYLWLGRGTNACQDFVRPQASNGVEDLRSYHNLVCTGQLDK